MYMCTWSCNWQASMVSARGAGPEIAPKQHKTKRTERKKEKQQRSELLMHKSNMFWNISIYTIIWKIYYGIYITADILQHIYCVQQKRPYLNKCTAPAALDCCIRICLWQRIIPASPGTSQTALRPPWGAPREPTRPLCHVYFEITHNFIRPGRGAIPWNQNVRPSMPKAYSLAYI